jgi:hypothetical protein
MQDSPLDLKAFPSSFVWKSEWVKKHDYTFPVVLRPKPSQRDGLKFERRIGKILSFLAPSVQGTYHFQLCFKGPEGLGYPDHVILTPSYGIVLETKLTFKKEGLTQLSRYAGLLGAFYGLPFFQVLIAKVLTPAVGSYKEVKSLSSVVAERHEGPFFWHIFWPERTLKDLQADALASDLALLPALE